MNKEWGIQNSNTTHNKLKENKESWERYHALYSKAREKWDEIPYEVIADKINKRPDWIVGDFGCGENLLSKELENTVHSFDHVAIDESVTSCDVSNVPLEDNSLDCAVFSLSLMGSNWKDYIKEARRVLKDYGQIFICEPRNKMEDKLDNIEEVYKELGFTIQVDKTSDNFIYIEGVKNI